MKKKSNNYSIDKNELISTLSEFGYAALTCGMGYIVHLFILDYIDNTLLRIVLHLVLILYMSFSILIIVEFKKMNSEIFLHDKTIYYKVQHYLAKKRNISANEISEFEVEDYISRAINDKIENDKNNK